ncbi:serine/threonine-protein kinase [Streptomyces sp. NPDC090077]|uniref:serine/threonine-protein kinase n=1 Tax=Streptomyces sp. NPDC090077 TaxID=3365938 RepID=UPI00380A2976
MRGTDGAGVPAGYRVGGWEVTGHIASGSWGSVYAARGAGGDEVALKFLGTQGLAPRQARELAATARREAEFSRQAVHPHLVRIFDTLTVDDPGLPAADGAVVLVMERAERSLWDVLAAGEPLPDAGAVLTEVITALAHLHAEGWVHGDLKPANILLSRGGSVRVADFGLVARLEGTHGYAPPWGSPDYLPPERRGALLDERGVRTRPDADVWAFGVTAHQVLTGGSLPFPGTTPAARAAAVVEYAAGRSPLRLAAGLPPGWTALIADCLSADPATRGTHTARSLIPRVREAAGTTSRRRGRGHRVVGVGAAVASLLACAGSGSGGAGRAESYGLPPVAVYVGVPGGCAYPALRTPDCRVDLVIDPRGYRWVGNHLALAAWPGDTLTAECEVRDGRWFADGAHGGSRRYYRVRVPGAPDEHAHLPALASGSQPRLPRCR